jgi:hypothetical protein
MRLLLAATVALAAPSPGERKALVAALRSLQGDVAIQKVAVAPSDRRFASVRWGFKVAQSDTLFQLRAGRWRVVYSRATDRPVDGACAFVPARVVRELFAVPCPGPAALHARPATSAEVQSLVAAFRKSPLTRYWRDAQRLANVCVSRLDASWAAALAKFPDTSGVIWFRRAGAWTVAHETPFGGGALPPPRIVLSLAACTRYNSAEYGG